jgi:hypothetical protein
MSEESAHGKLSEVDQKWTGPRFMGLLVGTLLVAITIIFTCASLKSGDFSWNPLAHDPVKHSLQSSQMNSRWVKERPRP